MSVPRIAVVGCWGVPARYGGFETLAEQLARNIPPNVARLTFYGQRSAFSPVERAGPFEGHERVWLPLRAQGAQSLVHDALQAATAVMRDGHRRLLVLGTSGAWILPFLRRLRPGLTIVTNIDGLEWRRDKFSRAVRILLKALEQLAVRASDVVVADNDALVPIVYSTYGKIPRMIAYGGDHIRLPESAGRDPAGPFLVIQRVEPENKADLILKAAEAAGAPLLFVGTWKGNSYARALAARYGGTQGIMLHPPVYDPDRLGRLRAGASAYVHGHSVGGTNPSLVEALFHVDRILAFDCPFNRATLEGEGAYFSDAASLATLMRQPESGRISPEALARLRARYRWQTVSRAYLDVFGLLGPR